MTTSYIIRTKWIWLHIFRLHTIPWLNVCHFVCDHNSITSWSHCQFQICTWSEADTIQHMIDRGLWPWLGRFSFKNNNKPIIMITNSQCPEKSWSCSWPTQCWESAGQSAESRKWWSEGRLPPQFPQLPWSWTAWNGSWYQQCHLPCRLLLDQRSRADWPACGAAQWQKRSVWRRRIPFKWERERERERFSLAGSLQSNSQWQRF